jgi:hypothetical protein
MSRPHELVVGAGACPARKQVVGAETDSTGNTPNSSASLCAGVLRTPEVNNSENRLLRERETLIVRVILFLQQ